MRWKPDTCYCIMDVPRPSVNGTFVQRCRIHPSPRTTTDVYKHNLIHRIKPQENVSDSARLIGEQRKAAVKLPTKP